MSAYELMVLPFEGKVRDLPKGKIEEYFTWFLEILPRRVALLTSLVKATRGFEEWQADFSPKSLDLLGQWLTENIKSKRLSPEELEEKKAALRFPIELSDKDLTYQSLSLAMDTGMYLSQVLVNNHPSLRWEVGKGGKTHVDYGQPVILGLGTVPFNPVRVMISVAYGIIDNEAAGDKLRRIYEELETMTTS